MFFAFVIIFLASLFGNTVIIQIIRTDNTMKNTTNYLILNQACVDLLTTLAEAASLLFYHSALRDKWFGGVLGLIACKLFHSIPFILAVVSMWILVTIAVDRFYAVTQLLNDSPLSRHLKKIIPLLWAWAFASKTDFLVNANLGINEENHYCKLNIPDDWKVFYVISHSLNFFLPLLIIAVLYTIVCLKLWYREVPGEGTNQNERQAEAMKTARKVTRMMIVIVVLYVVCLLPYFINLPFDISGQFLESGLIPFLIAVWFSCAYSGLNPYVYLTFNQKFRNGFKHLFRNCFRKIHSFSPSRSQSVELEQI